MAIISNPRVYEKLQCEIDYFINQNLISNPIQNVEAKQLPYFQACIWEGLRKHPPISQLRERVVPPEGDTLLGHWVPGGTFIGFNSQGTQLHEVFGSDPEVFRPERWLTEDHERLRAMCRVQELVFGYGSSKCLGNQVATMELNKTVFEVCVNSSLALDSRLNIYIVLQLLRNFDITTINPLSPWKSTCYGLFFQEDFNVRISCHKRCAPTQ